MFKKLYKYVGLTLVAGMLAGCGAQSGDKTGTDATGDGGNIKIDELTIGFVPSKDPDEIVAATKPLNDMVVKEMKNQGYDISKVEISVGTNYEAVGESLSAGTLDVGFIPGGTYVLYSDGADVILTATRAGLSIDSENPADWNDNKPTEQVEDQATFYRSLMIAGPTAKGKELAEKVNNGEKLTFEDLDSASWSVMSSSSSAGYIYPTIWFQENYDKVLTDLSKLQQADSYGSSFARLAAEQVDVMVVYADGRLDYEDTWTTEYGRTDSIWDETNIIGVSAPIYNDTISVSKNSEKMDDKLKKALEQAFINIAKTEEGKEVISIYSHSGYEPAKDSDYDNERKAQDIIKGLDN